MPGRGKVHCGNPDERTRCGRVKPATAQAIRFGDQFTTRLCLTCWKLAGMAAQAKRRKL